MCVRLCVCACVCVQAQADFLSTGTFPDPDTDMAPETAYGVAGALCLFLASLPDPPIPFAHFRAFVTAATLANSSVEDLVAAGTPPLQSAIAHAHLHAVERHECKSPRCREYRQLFDALPFPHRHAHTHTHTHTHTRRVRVRVGGRWRPVRVIMGV